MSTHMVENFIFLICIFQPSDEFGKVRGGTAKVDRLGSTLKKGVTRLREMPGQKLDLFFLVDSSASVGLENFMNEIKFIRKV